MKGKLIPNIGFIVGTQNYFTYIENNIFSKYYANNKCNKSIFNQRPNLVGEEYSFFYCQYTESLFKEIKSLFNPIIFKHNSLNENFILEFRDLFIKQNGYLIFLVIFSTHQHYYWDLGKPFMLKYQFEFDFDNKRIGYYKINKKENSDNINNNKSLKYVFIVIGIIILSGVLIFLGAFIGKYYFKIRKKRANELDDEFNYESNKDGTTPIINE